MIDLNFYENELDLLDTPELFKKWLYDLHEEFHLYDVSELLKLYEDKEKYDICCIIRLFEIEKLGK